MKILAVDDDALVLDLLEASLASSGHKDLIRANSAEEALELLDALDGPDCREGDGAFDLFLLDIQMPGMNGIELCKKVRGRAAYKNSPIIMISSLSDRKHVVNAFSSGATDYITKPFDGLELSSRIRLAKMIVDDRKKVLEAYFAGLVGESAKNSLFDAYFRQPVLVDDTPNLVDYRILENYLVNLGRKGLYRSASIAFKLLDAERILSRSGPEGLERAVQVTSDVISDRFSGTDSLLSYLGSGYFVMITSRGVLNAAKRLSETINSSPLLNRTSDQGSNLRVLVGDPVDCYDAARHGIEAVISKSLQAINEIETGEALTEKIHSNKELNRRAKKYNIWPKN